MDRYYCREIRSAQSAIVPDDQVHHALHVMRLRDGELVELFDGQGCYAQARAVINKKQIHFEIDGEVNVSPPPPFQLHVATAIPKSDRSEQLVDASSQLGVHTLSWIICERSCVKLDDRRGKLTKWHRVAVESAKQCRRNWLMQIEAPITLSDYLTRCTHMKVLANPLSPSHLTEILQQPRPPAITIFIGPEGGFTPDEMQSLLTAACQPFTLGVNILRIETAVAAAAAIMSKWSMPLLP